jgi:hypothetical protein
MLKRASLALTSGFHVGIPYCLSPHFDRIAGKCVLAAALKVYPTLISILLSRTVIEHLPLPSPDSKRPFAQLCP